MALNINHLWLASLLLFAASIVLSAYAWSRVDHLSLPMPDWVPAISTLAPVLIGITIPAAQSELQRVHKRFGSSSRFFAQRLPTGLLYTFTVILTLVLTISFVYVIPSEVALCFLDTQWNQMFRRKDANSIRTIQSSLRCCGLNSLHDRAWPFPAKGIGAGECERTQGWSQRCLEGWQREGRVAGGLIIAATILTGVLMILLSVLISRAQGRGDGQLRSLLHDTEGRVGEDDAIGSAEGSVQRRITGNDRYSDNPNENEGAEGFGTSGAVQISSLRE